MILARILLIEDDPVSAGIVMRALEAQHFEVTWCADGSHGLSEAGILPFDLIILDRMLPSLDGLTFMARLRDAGIATPILMLSALSRSENRVDGLEAGADDYLGKPFDDNELIARVRALLRRANNKVHSAVLLYADIEMHVKSRTVHRSGKHLPLSPKEFEILKLLMEHAGETVTRTMLLEKVWHLNFDPQTNVIDVNLSRLRIRLEEGFDHPILETVRGAGFRLITRDNVDIS